VAIISLTILPWLWFLLRGLPVPAGAFDLVGVLLPVLGGVAAASLATVALVTHRRVILAAAASFAVVTLIACVAPRLPRSSPEPIDPVRIAAANVFILNGRFEEAAAEIAGLDADVVAITEASPWFAKTLRAETGGRWPYGAAAPQLVLRSRWPVVHLPTPDALADQRILLARVDRPAGAFIVYLLHGYNPLHETTMPTQRDVTERLIESIAQEELPVVLTGDLNTSDRTSSYRLLDGRLRDAMRSSTYAPSTFHGRWWRLLFLRIDHLFVTPSWCANAPMVFDLVGSDHRGVAASVGPCP
jgi:endonuclease/exonuclease/phosphatase (EEP) superfamily protein YafD